KNNKDAHTNGKEHDDDIQKSVSPDIHSSSYGDQTMEQGDKAENKDKGKSHKVWILVDLPYGKRAIGFEDPEYPDKVYKVVKALYGLHQATRAWYETLATYLLENGFQRGTIDQILLIKKQ
nr:putative ribonuclease H-like domain-containing protein [Tanacetum cinerariifolium]